jgi:hypothetical protein
VADDALFRPTAPSTFVPTTAAVGPWDPDIVHGAAVSALFAGRLTPPEATLARLTIDFVSVVPLAPLTLALSEPSGGARVQRQEAELSCDGKVVAVGRSVLVRRGELDLPDKALDHDSPFAGAEVPALAEPNRAAAETVGRDSFDSSSLIIDYLKVEGDRRVHQWIALALPVVEGTELQGTEIAAVAADYAQSAVHRQLPFGDWSFRNTELTLHLAREPVGSWIGARCESVVQPAGAGFNTADLFDADGRVGRSAAALVVERRG